MKYFIVTYGCQMNKSDSERIAAILEKAGYRPAKNETQANLIVINACSVRQTAVDRIYGKVRNLTELRTKKKEHRTILTGCVLPEDKEKLKDKFDLVLGINEFKNLKTKELKNLKTEKFKNLKRTGLLRSDKSGLAMTSDYFCIQPRYTNRFSVFVPIMTGCNNFCSYCVVPYVRGREVSRDVCDVLDEVKQLAKNGCLEIMLLGQNVNTYKPKDIESFSKNNPYKDNFAALLWEINQIPGIRSMHFTASHPKDMSREVIDALALPKMVNYLHLPVQSGDNVVLRKMNRHYKVVDYINLIEKIRAKKLDIALGTDIIVGFPGETKKQFENTVKLYKKIGFDIAYLAMYSPRQGTAAAKLLDDVPRQEKKRRWNVLQKLMEKIVLEKNKKYVGKTVSVLADEFKNGECIGNSTEMKRVRFPGKKNMVGKIFDAKVNKAYEWILEGVVSSLRARTK